MGLTIIPTGLGVAEARYVNVAGDTMSGNLSLGGNILFDVGKLSMVGDIELGANKLKTTNLVLAEATPHVLKLMDTAEIDHKNLRLDWLYAYGGIEGADSAWTIRPLNVDGAYVAGEARQTGVGMVEIFRMVSAADPYFQATLPMVLKPSSAPGTPVEGHFYYDSVAKKLKFYNGTAWETVTSA